MKIGILGGAFNPPHIGHLWIAKQVLDFTDLDQVWFLPNFGQKYYGINPHKLVAPAEHRVAMTQMLEFPGAQTSTLEIAHELDGQTIHLLPHLPREHDFSFIMGSDQLPRFTEWHGYQELLTAMRFLVFPRFGYPMEPLHENMRILDHKELLVTADISSTKIRERVKRGLSIDGFVPPAVARYIHEQGLYREGIGLHKEQGSRLF